MEETRIPSIFFLGKIELNWKAKKGNTKYKVSTQVSTKKRRKPSPYGQSNQSMKSIIDKESTLRIPSIVSLLLAINIKNINTAM